MHAIKRHLLFTVWIFCCVVLVAAGLSWFLQLKKSTDRARVTVEKKIKQRAQWLTEILPTESAVIGAALEPALVVPAAEKAIPRRPLDAFIAIAGVVEELRQRANAEEVALLPDEGFGFVTYAHQGPAEKDLPAVHRQLGLTRLLVEKLLAARPAKLLAVRRERLPSHERDAPGEVAADFFQLDPRLDLRGAGLIEGGAIRLEFAGSTSVLRTFLASLVAAPETFVVRSVEVEPWLESGKSARPGSKMSVVVLRVNPMGPLVNEEAKVDQPSVVTGVEAGYQLFDSPVQNRGRREPASVAFAQKNSRENLAVPHVELLAVKRELFRLQLVGYYGVPGDYTAAFVSPGSAATLLAREGHRFETLGLVLKSISVNRFETSSESGAVGFELTASAQLWDERTEAPVTLIGSVLRLTDTLVAHLRVAALPARPRQFRIGDSFADGAALCRIEHIQLEPAEVVLVRELPGQVSPEKQILKPIAPAPVALSTAGRRP